MPQHKQFLDEHGYEFREYAEQEFARRISNCEMLAPERPALEAELVTTPGVLAPATYELLFEIETQPMTLCYKMLLLLFMTDQIDSNGRVSMLLLAERFRHFFIDRSSRHKMEENPKRLKPDTLSSRSLSVWERIIHEQPVRHLTESFVIDEGRTIRWSPRIWGQWNSELAREIRTACQDRLVRYFNRHVPGGY